MASFAADGWNHLSSYMLQEVANKLKVDKHNTTIKSIELSSSESGTENLVGAQKYIVTAEVNSKIDSATLLAQHPELNEATGAESGKFYGIKDAIHDYTEQIISINETFNFEDKDSGNKEFSHNIELTLRQVDYCPQCENGEWANDSQNFADEPTCRTYYNCPDATTGQSTRAAAANIATALFADDVNNTYFGHNAFAGALQNYGLTGTAANKHFFDETFDTIKNTYSFTKKMTVLKDSTTTYTTNKKYSIDISRDGKASVTETVELKSRNGRWDDLKTALPALKTGAHARTVTAFANYSTDTVFAAGTSVVRPTLYSVPLTQTVIHNKLGLTMTLSSVFTSDVQGGVTASNEVGGYQLLKTLDVSRDHRGVVTAIQNVTLTSHRSKSTSAEEDFWTTGVCSDTNQLNKTDCRNASGTWTPPKTPLDLLKDYNAQSIVEVNDALSYSFQGNNTANPDYDKIGVFWNTLNTNWPTGQTAFMGGMYTASGHSVWPVTTSVSSSSMGKTYTLTSTYSNDIMLSMHDITMVPVSPTETMLHKHCPGCFTKTEIKWNDTWPKRVVSEHTIINRGTSKMTNNRPNTTVLSDAYHTLVGKRSVTVSCQLARPVSSMLTNLGTIPITPSKFIPTNALKAMAAECKANLLEVFNDAKISDSYQRVFYISNLTYNYDSGNKVSMTAELTYSHKKPPPAAARLPAP